ncbi:MAG: hypothetical protein CMA31_06720 [Euryarchaeota archaeon]|nr:hypothetical protein [Euryarchaeota archaeon]|tara:strand:- start:9545 stop:11527 length:1983 start_codon:yes stop_codon:yes gene_type:complete
MTPEERMALLAAIAGGIDGLTKEQYLEYKDAVATVFANDAASAQGFSAGGDMWQSAYDAIMSEYAKVEARYPFEGLGYMVTGILNATDKNGAPLLDPNGTPRKVYTIKSQLLGQTLEVTEILDSRGNPTGTFSEYIVPAAPKGEDLRDRYIIKNHPDGTMQRIDKTTATSEVSVDGGKTWTTGSFTEAQEVDAVEISTEIITNASDGQQYIINSATGEKISGALGVDPDWQYKEGMLDVSEGNLGVSQGNLEVAQGQLAENQRQFNLEFDEDRSQWTREFGEEQRQFDTGENRLERTLAANNYFNSLNELGRNYRTLIQTAPQMANAATNQGELIRNILSQGGDVLARTFFTRGGQSPLPEITQADLLNNLSKEMTNIQQYESNAIKAENDRRTRADSRRADEEFRQAEEQRRADARAQYGRFVNEMRPTVNESSSFDAEGYKSQQERIADAQANLDNATNFDYSSIVVGTNPDGSDRLVDPNLVAGIRAQSIKTAQDALDAIPAATEADYTTFSRTETMPDKPSFADWMATSEFATPLDRATFKTSFAPSQQLTVPEVPVPRLTSQAELIASDIATRPPAVDAMFAGTMPNALQFGDLPLPTLQQLNTLTPTERQMFNTSLLTQFNTPLEDVALQSQRQFGAPSMDRNRDLAKFRGYAR